MLLLDLTGASRTRRERPRLNSSELDDSSQAKELWLNDEGLYAFGYIFTRKSLEP